MVPGWLGPAEDDFVRRFDSGPGHTMPALLLPADTRTPERLLARYYFWVHNQERAQMLTSAPVQTHYRLEAVDVMFSLDATGSVIALVASRAEDMVSTAMNAISSAVSGARITRSAPTPLHLGDADFFLWAMEWILNGTAIAEINPIEAISLRTRDSSAKPSVIWDTVDSLRNSFLNAVASHDTLDQLRFIVRIGSIPAKLTPELYLDGSFVVITSGVHYGPEAHVANEHLRAVEDVAFFLIPTLLQAYSQDAAWHGSRRLAFEAEARSTLIARLSAGISS